MNMYTVELKESGVDAGLLRFSPSRFTRAIRVRPRVVSITPCFEPDRSQVAAFIEATYRERFGARIRADYPNLVSVRTSGGDLVAAAGFRIAAQGVLFLEQYMNHPVEVVLGAPRDRIVEIGNLASSGGASLFLFAALAAHLDHAGISYAVVTSSSPLERRLRRLGLEPRRLCAADPSRLDGSSADWGSYYDTRPSVLAGSVPRAVQRLKRIFGDDYFERRPRLFPRLHFDRSLT